MQRAILAGKPYPQGATWDGGGVNFSIYSESASGVELCLFDDPKTPCTETIRLTEQEGHVWHCYLPGIKLGQLYGFRVHGPYEPEKGLRFNPAKLLIDPYAKALAGQTDWNAPVFGYPLGDPEADLKKDDRDDAAAVPKSVVTAPNFDWQHDHPPQIPLHDSIIYEVHVKGLTISHPGLPESIRGTYAGLAHPVIIEHFKKLGVTAIELMPVHAFIDDKQLLDRGLRNYWGYNTINFFSPEARYCSAGDRGEQIGEFKTMVKSLHRAGFEVILDVVYNHTAEGNQLGPTLSFRGIDNPNYYRLVTDDARHYMDYTGTGNTLNVRHPQVLKLVMDSLRYWVLEMHVDGFRFDLAAALARELHEVDRLSAFFDVINQDPVISQVKLIAEPWDVGEGGYQVGKFPPLWAEWNGRYRDVVRRYWKGDDGQLAELGYRLTGSSDLYEREGRRPTASINFVTAHDGFTLDDLVSYDNKHNEANGEENRDGSSDNHSWNHGAEGPTDDPAILELRERDKRNLLGTLLLSQGVPMLCGGDEIGRTQRGNNNTYAQDNELSWFDWNLDDRRQALLTFTRFLTHLRKRHPNLHRRKFFQDRPIDPKAPDGRVNGEAQKDILWLRPDGEEMAQEEWHAGWIRSFGLLLNGRTLDDMDAAGEAIVDDTFLILLNPHHEPIRFFLPQCRPGTGWVVCFDTRNSTTRKRHRLVGRSYKLIDRSLVLLREAPLEESKPPETAEARQ
ncbi:MAG TPA: glycogen debranching protein GlgX [Bryobacteraceae bacterium]|nr:glycogen debranching protein GlgX [Bryobacteraceae bacterium]